MLLATGKPISTAVTALCTLILVSCLWATGPKYLLDRHTQAIFAEQTTSPQVNSFAQSNFTNSTLGFGAIYVLTEDSRDWRVQGLLQAANLTGLHIHVPVQKRLTDQEVFARVKKAPDNGWGHAHAFLGHIALLETFLESGHETALILEDDADFGVDIRHSMELLSRAMWEHSGETWTTELAHLHPYREDDWDIFWIGHFAVGTHVLGCEVFEYDDPHALPWSRLFMIYENYYDRLAEGSTGSSRQQVLYNVTPLGSFAYATTRSHAARMLNKYREKDGYLETGNSFDWALHLDCEGLWHRCVAAVPQLFHHHTVSGQLSINEVSGDDPGEIQDMDWYASRHKYTYNIEWSARCNAAHAGERIGERWQCLPNKDDPGVSKKIG